jgi:rhombotail lipoprotein
MALVSYDQVAVTTDRARSLLYWTIVGAYVIKGNENQVSTFVDTAVFDVRSQKMLFRAPGIDETERSSTLIRASEVNRKARTEGFELAMSDMTANLEIELDRFKDRIRTDQSVQITHAPGYGGSGAIQWPVLLFVVGLALVRLYRR